MASNEPEVLKLAQKILSADQKQPGTIEVLSKIAQSGLLDNSEDLTDLKTIIDLFGRRRKVSP